MACAGPARDRLDDPHRGRARRRCARRPPHAGPGEGRRARSRNTPSTTPCSVGASGPGRAPSIAGAIHRRVAINRHGLRDPERDYAPPPGALAAPGAGRLVRRGLHRAPSGGRDPGPGIVADTGRLSAPRSSTEDRRGTARTRSCSSIDPKGTSTRRASCFSSSTTTTSCTTTARNTSAPPSPCSRWEAATFVSTASRCASAPPQAVPRRRWPSPRARSALVEWIRTACGTAHPGPTTPSHGSASGLPCRRCPRAWSSGLRDAARTGDRRRLGEDRPPSSPPPLATWRRAADASSSSTPPAAWRWTTGSWRLSRQLYDWTRQAGIAAACPAPDPSSPASTNSPSST